MHPAMLFTAAVAAFAACASEFDLGDDVRASVDEKGGFVFRVGGERLAFAPFEITEPEDASGYGHYSPRIRFHADGDALVAEVEGDERNFGNVAFGRCSEKPAAVYFGWTKTREAFRLVTEPGKPNQKTLLPIAVKNLADGVSVIMAKIPPAGVVVIKTL